MKTPVTLGLIAGSGIYPLLLAKSARAAGVRTIAAVGFTGETDPELGTMVDSIEWIRVGQLSRMISSLRAAGASEAIMAGQISPKNLFDLRPDMKALLLLAKLPKRNAASIFSAIANELAVSGVTLLPAVTFLEDELAPPGLIAGRSLSRRQLDDVHFGAEIAREISRLDIGQTVVVKNGTTLAVEGFDGSDATIKRGGLLGRKNAVVVKVAKPDQDLRFDVPVVGIETLRVAEAAGISVIAVSAGKTLLLERRAVTAAAERARVTIFGI